MFKNRLKAASAHLLLSFILISFVIGCVIYFWYPINYISITNFKDLALLIITIDLILGPILTFVVFNPAKKSIKFDLAVIVAIQFAALVYGVNALYQTHPLYITFNHGAFNLIHANEVTPGDAKHKEFKVSKISSPILAYAKMPNDPQKKTEIMMSVDLKGEPDIDKRTQYYEPHQNHMDIILKNSIDNDKLFDEKNLNPSSKAFLKKHGNKENYSYIPLEGVAGTAIIVLDKKSAKVVTTINIDPWSLVNK